MGVRCVWSPTSRAQPWCVWIQTYYSSMKCRCNVNDSGRMSNEQCASRNECDHLIKMKSSTEIDSVGMLRTDRIAQIAFRLSTSYNNAHVTLPGYVFSRITKVRRAPHSRRASAARVHDDEV